MSNSQRFRQLFHCLRTSNAATQNNRDVPVPSLSGVGASQPARNSTRRSNFPHLPDELLVYLEELNLNPIDVHPDVVHQLCKNLGIRTRPPNQTPHPTDIQSSSFGMQIPLNRSSGPFEAQPQPPFSPNNSVPPSNPEFEALLCDAIQNGDVTCVIDLLNSGVSPNNYNEREGYHRPLHLAAIQGNAEIIRRLHDKGGVIDLGNQSNWRALHFACGAGNMECIKQLVDFGADVNVKTNAGATPLMISVQQNNAEIVDYLISKGGDPDAVDNKGFSALHYCAEEGRAVAAQQLLLKRANINAVDDSLRTPLRVVRTGDLTMIQLLVVNGAQIDALDATGQSPLSVAFDNGDDETILCMLNGASTSSGESYALDVEHLITAVKSGRKDLIQLCLPFILDINMMNQEGKTALYMAAQEGNVEIGQILVANGASIEEPSKERPLHVALRYEKESFVNYLLSLGASVLATSENGLTSMHYASAADFPVSVRLIRRLKENGVDIDQRDTSGYTALHGAVQIGLIEVVRMLLNEGANPHLVTDEGQNALQIAEKAQHFDVRDLLLLNMIPKTSQIPSAPRPSFQQSNAAMTETDVLLCCPITLELMRDPVLAADGITYERNAIMDHIRLHGTSPLTNHLLDISQLIPNQTIRDKIQAYKTSMGWV